MAPSNRPNPGTQIPDPQWHCLFFTIPPELRNRIYEDLLYVPTENNCIAIVHERETSGSPSVLRLLLTCKQIRDEAEGIFYNVNELYFDVSTIDLPNFHRFLRTLSPRRRNKIMRINLDLTTVESVAPLLMLIAHFSSLRKVTLGFPRGGDRLSKGVLQRKLKSDAQAIKSSIMSMQAIEVIKVVVAGEERRRRNPLVVDLAMIMENRLQSLVCKKNDMSVMDGPETRLQKSSAETSCHEPAHDGSILPSAESGDQATPVLSWPTWTWSGRYTPAELWGP